VLCVDHRVVGKTNKEDVLIAIEFDGFGSDRCWRWLKLEELETNNSKEETKSEDARERQRRKGEETQVELESL
jgi:hypothetical protein